MIAACETYLRIAFDPIKDALVVTKTLQPLTSLFQINFVVEQLTMLSTVKRVNQLLERCQMADSEDEMERVLVI